MIYIPNEVLSNILCRLPVKSLLRFRLVSKSWRKLIDDRVFIKLHRNHSIELKSSSANAEIILYQDFTLYSVPFDSLDSQTTDSTIVAHPRNLHGPQLPCDDQVLVYGYCNGLFFLAIGLKCVLWNPSTHKYHVMPDFEFKKLPEGRHQISYDDGFGYDQATDDYKVVDIMQAIGEPFEAFNETMVYSLKSNCWRRIKEFPLQIYNGKGGVFSLGALHWLVFAPIEVGNKFMIVALDIGTEVYEHILLPLGVGTPHRIDLGCLDGFLSLSCCYRSDRVDIWLMKGRRDRACWAKQISIALVDVKCCLKNLIPVAYSRSGNHVLLEKDNEQLMWYDLRKKVGKKVRMSSGPRSFSTVFHLGCLARVNDEVSHEVDKKMGRAEMQRKKTKKRDDFLSKGFKLKL